MSGIAGIVSLRGAPPDAAVLARMRQALAFRGPDGGAAWSAGSAGLVHTALGTGDEAAPLPQPANLDGRFWITADARIDDREALLGRLRAAGEAADGDAPAAELILRAYRRWGAECVSRLLGDFCFAVWDAEERTLFCARDHFGAKPFYYAALEGEFVFSNTLECVRLHPGVSAELDERAVGDFLLFGTNLDLASTTFSAIRCLPPAHSLTVRDGTVRISRYWSLPTDGRARGGSIREQVERFTAVLETAVADRLPRGKAGILLSGGHDSTAVAATARGVAPQVELRGFTVGHERLLEDPEPRFARRAAEHLGIAWECQALDGYGPFGGPDAARTPEPVDDPLLAASAALHRRAASYAAVALTGDGGDMALRESESRLARLVTQGRLLRAAVEAAEYVWWHRRLPRPGIRTLLGRRSGRIGGGPEVPDWLDEDFARRCGLRERWAELEVAIPPAHPLRPEAHRLLAWPGLTRLLERMDAGLRRVPLELRHPLLDLRLVESSLYTPPAQWYNDKGLLKIATRGRLPPEIVRRPKSPLAGDPLLARLRRDGEGWLGGRTLGEEVRRFVRPAAVPRVAGGEAEAWDAGRLQEDLRPLALSLWLKAMGDGNEKYV